MMLNRFIKKSLEEKTNETPKNLFRGVRSLDMKQNFKTQ